METKRLLEGGRVNFLIPILEGPALVIHSWICCCPLHNKGLVDDVVINDSHGCSDHDIVEFSRLREIRKESARVGSLWTSGESTLIKKTSGQIPYDATLKWKHAQER